MHSTWVDFLANRTQFTQILQWFIVQFTGISTLCSSWIIFHTFKNIFFLYCRHILVYIPTAFNSIYKNNIWTGFLNLIQIRKSHLNKFLLSISRSLWYIGYNLLSSDISVLQQAFTPFAKKIDGNLLLLLLLLLHFLEQSIN